MKYDGRITYDVACFALNLLEVDQYGLDKIDDRRILQTMIVNFPGWSCGTGTLAAAIGEDSGTLEDVYEPYLLQNGFLNVRREDVWHRRLRMSIWAIRCRRKTEVKGVKI